MTKEDDYKLSAAETIGLANRAATSADKGHLLDLAEKWLGLADRAQAARLRRERRKSALGEHPLLRRKLGPDRREAE
ncbi:MAG TPA: hypothetical protein VGG11_18405 [Xanthobacteraceae bacterium]|jgi:hypothetical protein